jgi:hypothetical protein
MQPLFPKVGTIASPDGRSFPLVTHCAKSMIKSLLTSSLMEDDSNLLFPDLNDPLAPPPSVVNTLADIDTGRIYCGAYDLLWRGRPNHVLCGIILYIDKLAVDCQHHRCSDVLQLEVGGCIWHFLPSCSKNRLKLTCLEVQMTDRQARLLPSLDYLPDTANVDDFTLQHYRLNVS